MIDTESGDSPELPNLSFKNKASEKFFDRTFPLRSADETQQELREKVHTLLGKWNESLDKSTDFTCPEGFDVMWVGAKDWNELKDNTSCSQCGFPVKYAQSHCSACSTAKPHFILTVQETETSLQLLGDVIDDEEMMPKVLPEGCKYTPVGVNDSAELNKYKNCLYCGAPVLMTFPSCAHCGMSKPHLQLVEEKGDNSPVKWETPSWETTNSQHNTPKYLDGKEITVTSGYGGGICKAEKLFVEDKSSVVAGNAIEITLGINAKAHELAAKQISIGKNASVHSVTVYDGGRLILDSSVQIDELFLGSGVSVEIRGVFKPEIFQRIRELFSTNKQGHRSHVKCDMPDGMRQIYQKG